MSFSDTELLRRLFDAAVAVADPMQVIPAVLGERPEGRLIVIGAGKASARMAEAVESRWGPCAGLVITRYGYARPCQGIEIVEAGHPVPDAAGHQATERMLDMVAGLDEADTVLALMSGGGSALLCAPAEPMTLKDKQAMHRALLNSGAPIEKMNTVRKHLSRVKGGKLAAAVYPAKLRTLLISDVSGDDPADIASGPTVGDATTAADALAIVAEYGIALPARAREVLDAGRPVIAPGDPMLARVSNQVVAAPSQSLDAARELAEREGYAVEILGDAIDGEAREEGARQARLALDVQARLRADDQPVALLSGGECTVTGWGGGVGGPNAEFALAAAITLAGRPGISLIACDTDGVDGAAEIAGAIVTQRTLSRARDAGIDPAQALRRNDSHGFFAAVGGQVVTGPTLTNVNDFRAILVRPARMKPPSSG